MSTKDSYRMNFFYLSMQPRELAAMLVALRKPGLLRLLATCRTAIANRQFPATIALFPRIDNHVVTIVSRPKPAIYGDFAKSVHGFLAELSAQKCNFLQPFIPWNRCSRFRAKAFLEVLGQHLRFTRLVRRSQLSLQLPE